jgi:hypothetical protein
LIAAKPIASLCILLFFLHCATSQANDGDYASELVERARNLNLASDPYWHSLLHYKPALRGGFASQADDGDFFNDPQGKTEPLPELDATLQAFFTTGDNDRHPICRFPARLHWLTEQLHIDPQRLPVVSCTEYQAWRGTLQAHSATLVFPAAYLNGPSSMFGHTLLRINPGDTRRDVPLAAYALNYAANANPVDNGAFYAYKGIFGGYPGIFSIVPYYQKINEYSDLENRDIWEYELNLNQQEVDQLLRHAWEVRTIQFDYYFLTENCSYHMLSLLEVARPGSNLTDSFAVKAIPADTVRAVVRIDMVSAVNYRPSTTTAMKQRLGLLSEAQQASVWALGSGNQTLAQADVSEADPVADARVLELAFDYSRFLALQNASVRDKNASQSYQLLTARSELPAGNVWPEIHWPESRPEQGHRTSRLALGSGRQDGRNFISAQYRPAYHDILDPLPGYTRGAQINFLDVRGRFYPDKNSLKLEKFTLIDILSLTPRDRFFKPVSWGVDSGYERMLSDKGTAHGIQVKGVGGLTYKVAGDHLAYLLAQAQLKAAKGFEDNFSAGAGVLAGLLLFFDHSTANLEFRGMSYQLGDRDELFTARWRQSFPLGRQQAIRYILEHRYERDQEYNSAQLLVDWYF